MASTLF